MKNGQVPLFIRITLNGEIADIPSLRKYKSFSMEPSTRKNKREQSGSTGVEL
ncbi:hypothetical protein JGH11_17650 [Dysgonomonas sp. Marseille-P4677]|nr:hypothetical protein [Dysgonomonas sp. Marseille-P4677]